MDDDWKRGPKEFVSKNQMTDKQLKELIEKIDREQKDYTIPLSPLEKKVYTDKNGKEISVTIEKSERKRNKINPKSKRVKCGCKKIRIHLWKFYFKHTFLFLS